MKYFVNPATYECYAYDDDQIAAGHVKEGLTPCDPRPVGNYIWNNGWQLAPDTRTYAEKRAAEYPPMADYIDGIVKGNQAQVDAYIAACLAVKSKYPKP